MEKKIKKMLASRYQYASIFSLKEQHEEKERHVLER